jgi:hypothetical protein
MANTSASSGLKKNNYQFLQQNSINKTSNIWLMQPLWSGNPQGIVGPIKGGVILGFLSQRLNFT